MHSLEIFIFMLVLAALAAVVLGPILAILAFRRAGLIEERLRALENKIRVPAPRKEAQEVVAPPQPGIQPEASAPEPVLAALDVAAPPAAARDSIATEEAPPVESETGPAPAEPMPARDEQDAPLGIESQLGVRVAAWVGAGLLLIGAGFFVTYAIQHGWISPGLRVTLGVLFGAILTAAAYNLERRGFPVLARVLTAGGCAMMYFSIFAARGFYGLIGPGLAFSGLALVSAAAMALSALYNSQAIALGALLGGFLVPPLTGSETRDGIFFLAYMALLNLPAIGLGLKRRWQWLYNIAAGLSWLAYFIAVFDEFNGLGTGDLQARLLFAAIFFAQFTFLGMLKLRSEEAIRRPLDLTRQALNSILALAAIYFILEDADLDAWMGAAMLAGALAHLALAAAARRSLPRFTDDAMVFLLGGATFAIFAVPLQFDGPWVSVGWAIEGVMLAWFAARVNSPLLRTIALAVTGMGWIKAHLYDPTLYTDKPALFFNGRFAAGLLAALAFLAQSRFAGRRGVDDDSRKEADWAGGIAVIALYAFAIALTWECWFVFGMKSALGAAAGTLAIVVAAAVVWRSEWAEEQGILRSAAWVLAALAVFKILTIDQWALAQAAPGRKLLLNMPALGLLLSAGAAAFVGGRERDSKASLLHIVSALAAIVTITSEISRATGLWVGAAITIFWACAAMALVGIGLAGGRKYLRWLGLILFAIAAAKALLVDLGSLRGGPRIISFMVAGVLFLLLSFVYQKLSRLAERPGEEE